MNAQGQQKLAKLCKCTIGLAMTFNDWQKSMQMRDRQVSQQKASQRVEQFMVRNGVPGLSVGVTQHGRCVWKQGFGLADLEQMVPCTSETVMRIASISKSVTAALAARLVQQKKLELDVSVQKYVPEFPLKKFNGENVQITTRQLLSHTSGIRHYKKVDYDNISDHTDRIKTFETDV